MSYFEEMSRLEPEFYAKQVLYDCQITSFPVDTLELVEKMGIIYRETDFKGIKSVDGCFVRKVNTIIINSEITTERKNFTISHEIGHATIPGHDANEYKCTGRDTVGIGSNKHEYEANRFAAELLMPEQKIREIVDRSSFNLMTVQKISLNFNTSLTSAAIRAVQFSLDPCAVVVSCDQKVTWSIKSKRFRYEICRNLSENTFAIDYFKNQIVPEGPQPVLPEAWLFGAPKDIQLTEHSLNFLNYGLVFTLLYVKLSEDDYDKLEDEDK